MTKRLNDFQKDMEKYLIDFKEIKQFLPGTNIRKCWEYYDIADNLFPPIKHGFLQYAYDKAIPLHDYFNHVRSSQAFAVNLIYPMLLNEPEVLLKQLQEISQENLNIIERFVFEYSPETNLLGEWKSRTQPDCYVTATDIAIFCRNSAGERYIFLIEVKFTESEFTQCGGYKSNGNQKEMRRVCENRRELFQRKDKCYLQIGTRGKSPRKYFDFFGDLATEFPNSHEITCPFQTNHQCLRNHAFARALVAEDYCDKAYFGLLYHDQNKAIEGEWNKYIGLVANRNNELFSIKATQLLNESNNYTLRAYFKARYLLGLGCGKILTQ